EAGLSHRLARLPVGGLRLAGGGGLSAPRARRAARRASAGRELRPREGARRGALDLVIGNWPQPPEQLHLSLILEDEVVCLVAREHPFALADGKPSAEQYLAAAHIVPMPYSVAHRGVVETHLATLRVKRQAIVTLPSFHLAPYLLPGTDLVFTTS